jgi:enolase
MLEVSKISIVEIERILKKRGHRTVLVKVPSGRSNGTANAQVNGSSQGSPVH